MVALGRWLIGLYGPFLDLGGVDAPTSQNVGPRLPVPLLVRKERFLWLNVISLCSNFIPNKQSLEKQNSVL